MSEKHVEDLLIIHETLVLDDDDVLYVSDKTGSSYVSGAIKADKVRPKLGSVTYVDTVAGVDATAIAGSFIHRFKTIQAALTAASLSSTAKNVEVFAGTYAESLVLKNNVNLNLNGGALVNSVGVAAQDGGQPVVCTISGPGKIAGVTAGLQLTNSSSNVLALNREITASGGQPIILQDATLAISARLRSTWNNASGGCILRQGNGGILSLEPPCSLYCTHASAETIISANIASGLFYNGSGALSISVTAGALYYVLISGGNDTSLTNGVDVYTAIGTFTAAASSVTLAGTPSAACGVVLKRVFDLYALGLLVARRTIGLGTRLATGAIQENSNLL